MTGRQLQGGASWGTRLQNTLFLIMVQSVVKVFLILLALVAFRFTRTVLGICLYLEGDWLVWHIAIICLMDVPEWTICGRGGELNWFSFLSPSLPSV